MKNPFKILILLIFFSPFVFGQVKNHAFSGRFNITLSSGITITKSDYEESQTGLLLKGSLEYFFPTSSPSSFGLRLSGGGMTAEGKDERRLVSEFSTDINMIGLGLVYCYSISDDIFPYLYAGLSQNWFNPKTGEGKRAPNNAENVYDESTLSYDFEFGLRIPLSNYFSIQVGSGIHFFSSDVIDDISPEHVLDFPAGPNNDFVATGILGITYAFSGGNDSDGDGIDDEVDMCPNTPKGIIIDEYGCPLDGDNDGVPDYVDKCSATAKGVTVDTYGCPVDSDKDGVADDKDECPETALGITVDDKGCPSDLDNDGVADYLDECPATGAGVSVDSKGCPNDSDFDGVPDSSDICPDTPAGAKVDTSGCVVKDTTPEKKTDNEKKEPKQETKNVPDLPINTGNNTKTETKTTLPPIAPGTSKIVLQSDEIFVPGTSNISDDAKDNLRRVINFLARDPWTKWKIQGYVDSEAPENLKASLSYEKANAILNYFVGHGLPSFQFQVYGLGDESPVAANSTPDGRSKNRRIEIEKIKK